MDSVISAAPHFDFFLHTTSINVGKNCSPLKSRWFKMVLTHDTVKTTKNCRNSRKEYKSTRLIDLRLWDHQEHSNNFMPGVCWYPVCLALKNSSAAVKALHGIPVMQDGQPYLEMTNTYSGSGLAPTKVVHCTEEVCRTVGCSGMDIHLNIKRCEGSTLSLRSQDVWTTSSDQTWNLLLFERNQWR